MEKLDNKGFTLVELIATVVLLVLVMGIGAFSITKIINNSKEKDYELLIKNIKDAAELYYQECKYGNISKDSYECDKLSSGVALENLVKFGYLTGNSKVDVGDNKDTYTLVNPKDGKSITSCNIKITYDTINRKVVVSTDEQEYIKDEETNEMIKNSCPTDKKLDEILGE